MVARDGSVPVALVAHALNELIPRAVQSLADCQLRDRHLAAVHAAHEGSAGHGLRVHLEDHAAVANLVDGEDDQLERVKQRPPVRHAAQQDVERVVQRVEHPGQDQLVLGRAAHHEEFGLVRRAVDRDVLLEHDDLGLRPRISVLRLPVELLLERLLHLVTRKLRLLVVLCGQPVAVPVQDQDGLNHRDHRIVHGAIQPPAAKEALQSKVYQTRQCPLSNGRRRRRRRPIR
mmetsp:Transcript_4674/g.10054  ORF Transcript_4674/g.10054 Transcript_4674/m.10054 type:complete len:231 (-) Transcript_4674:304-996(-)